MFSGLPDIVLATPTGVSTVSSSLIPAFLATPQPPLVMKPLLKQKHWKKLSAKTRKFVSKMIPVEDNVFRAIPWNSSSQSTQLQQDPGCNRGNETRERNNIYLNPFKRIAATLKIKKKSGTNEAREHSSITQSVNSLSISILYV